MLAIMALAFQAEAALPTAITLSKLSKGATGVTMSVTLTPTGQLASTGKIIITLTGAGLALASPPATLVFNAPSTGAAGTAAISGAGPFVVTVTLTTGSFDAGSPITFTIPGFTNPTTAQGALSNVAAATTAADGTTVVDSTTVGTYPAILEPLGVASPVITLSKLSKGATGVTMSVTLTPGQDVASTGKIILTVTGAGLALASPPATLVFTAPSTGAAGTAAISGAGPFVVTVTLTTGTFTRGSPITFTIPGFTNPTTAQGALSNVAAATTAADGTTVVDSTTVGTYPAIVEPSTLPASSSSAAPAPVSTTAAAPPATTNNGTSPGPAPGPAATTQASASSVASSAALLVAAIIVGVLL